MIQAHASRRQWGLLSLLSLLACTGTVRGQARPDLLELQVKAAYLYNFIGFVEWPADAFDAAHDPLEIGVMEADALADQLVRVLPQWQSAPLLVSAMTPRRDGDPAKVRVALEALRRHFTALPGTRAA